MPLPHPWAAPRLPLQSDCGMKSTLGSLQAAVGQLKTAMVAVELRPLGAAAADSADCLQASRAC